VFSAGHLFFCYSGHWCVPLHAHIGLDSTAKCLTASAIGSRYQTTGDDTADGEDKVLAIMNCGLTTVNCNRSLSFRSVSVQ
jgi:hypothetical protein